MEYNKNGRKVEFTTILEDKENATIFRHFKGNEYKIICIGKDSNNLNDVVIYQGEYENHPIWVREIDEFFSSVDHEKYPEVTQKYRFEKL